GGGGGGGGGGGKGGGLGGGGERSPGAGGLGLEPEAAVPAGGEAPRHRGCRRPQSARACRRHSRRGGRAHVVRIVASRRLRPRNRALTLAVHPWSTGQHAGREPHRGADPLQTDRQLSTEAPRARPS